LLKKVTVKSRKGVCGSPVVGNFINVEIVNAADAVRVSFGTYASLITFCPHFNI